MAQNHKLEFEIDETVLEYGAGFKTRYVHYESFNDLSSIIYIGETCVGSLAAFLCNQVV